MYAKKRISPASLEDQTMTWCCLITPDYHPIISWVALTEPLLSRKLSAIASCERWSSFEKQHTSASLRWILCAYGSKSCVPHSATNLPKNRFFRATQLSTCVAPAKMCCWQKIERITRQFGEAQPCTGQLCSISSSSRNVETRALNAFFLLNWWILDIKHTKNQQMVCTSGQSMFISKSFELLKGIIFNVTYQLPTFSNHQAIPGETCDLHGGRRACWK